MRDWTAPEFPPLHSIAPLIARIVAPNPWLRTGSTFSVQNHKAVLKEITASVATVSGEFNPSNPMLFPAGP
jgi:hypothetical protein